jgi:predicted RNA-binding protein YlqC (UPF0109 family)
MAKFTEVVEEIVDPNVSSLVDSTVEDLPVEQPTKEPEEVKQPEEDLPEKYRGKSVKEIALMHQEAEKLIGRQGSEVGELRKVVDDFIKTQTPANKKTEEVVEEEDFFVDPEKAVKKVIDTHPDVVKAREQGKQFHREAVLTKIGQEFPDFMKTVQDPAFADWIKSSKIRTELYARADAGMDYDSAVELLSTWEERKKLTKTVTETSKVDREQQLKTADVGSTGGDSIVSKKKYRRSDIIKLMQTDPDRYDALSEEIMKAYQEGRVV